MSFLIGLLAGAFGGFLGIGGGIIMIPLMVYFFGLQQREAHATSLAALVVTGVMGAITYGLHGSIDYAAALLIAASAIGTARLGALSSHTMTDWKLRRCLGAFLLFVVLVMLAKPYIAPYHAPLAGWGKMAALLGIGLFTGFVSGMLGVGGGSIMIPGMVLIVAMTQICAQGTSLLSIIPIGATGAWTHWRLGNVRHEILPGLLGGIIAGSLAGGTVAQYMPEALLKGAFSVLLVWLGLRYLGSKAPAGADIAPSDD